VTPRAITGFGIVSALGIGREAFFEGMREPPPQPASTQSIEAFDATAYQKPLIIEVKDFDASRYLGDKGLRSLDRQTKLLVVATRLCLQDAGLKKEGAYVALSPERVGFCASNAYGSLESITELDRVAVLEDARYINPAKFPNTVANSASGYASIWEDLRALNVAVSDGNCGALDAVTCANIYLEAGRADAIVVGGAEALSEPLYMAFQKVGALTAEAKLGEGAALFVLEREDVAASRGAKALAFVAGSGTAFGAPSHDGPLLHASTEAMERAITLALADASLSAQDVELVVSGATGSGSFLEAELGAVTRVFGSDTAIAAPKAMFGETLGAGGAMGMAAALAWMDGVPVRTVVAGRVKEQPRVVVVTALGFYGNATAVVMRSVSRAS